MSTPTHTSMNTLGTAASARRTKTSSKALASLLLGAGVAALVVMADQLMEPWSETHEMAAWVVLWVVTVLAIAALRGLTRRLAQKMMQGLDTWSAGVAQRRSDRRLWAMAQNDPRMMADLESALARADEGPAQDMAELSQRRVARIIRNRLHYI